MTEDTTPVVEPPGVVGFDPADLPLPFIIVPRTRSSAARETNGTVGTAIRNVLNITQSTNVGHEIRSALVLISGLRAPNPDYKTDWTNVSSEVRIIKEWEPGFAPFVDPDKTVIDKDELHDVFYTLSGSDVYDKGWWYKNDVLHFADIYTKFVEATSHAHYANTNRLSFMYYLAMLLLRREYDVTDFEPDCDWSTWRWVSLLLDMTNRLFDNAGEESPYAEFITEVQDLATGQVGQGMTVTQTGAFPYVVSEEYERNNNIPTMIQAWADFRMAMLARLLDSTTRTYNSLNTLLFGALPHYTTPYTLPADKIAQRDVSGSNLHWMTLLIAVSAVKR